MQLERGNMQPLTPSTAASGGVVGGSTFLAAESSPISSFEHLSHTTSSPYHTQGFPLPQLHSVRLRRLFAPVPAPLTNLTSNGHAHQTPPGTHAGSAWLHSPLLNLPDESPRTTQSPISPAPQLPPAMMYQYIFNIDTSIPFEAQTPENQASLACEWNRYLPNLGTVQLSRFEHDTILSRCFNYGASWLFGLIPDLILRDLADCLRPETAQCSEDMQHYTPLLHCSLLAFGAAFSDDPNIRAHDTRDRFATHAKQWLDEEYHHVNPCLILSLTLLSEYHHGIGLKNTAYMYMGE
jgi:hypothetical protein